MNLTEEKRLNELLREVEEQARAVGIPISGRVLPQVAVNRRAKQRFGCCKRLSNGDIQIELSLHTLSAEEKEIKQVLAHELLHSCYGCMNHQKRWKSYAERMNRAYGYMISRTDSVERLGIEQQKPKPKYRLVCTRCGAEITRMKRSRLITDTELYRCRCGGELKRIK